MDGDQHMSLSLSADELGKVSTPSLINPPRAAKHSASTTIALIAQDDESTLEDEVEPEEAVHSMNDPPRSAKRPASKTRARNARKYEGDEDDEEEQHPVRSSKKRKINRDERGRDTEEPFEEGKRVYNACYSCRQFRLDKCDRNVPCSNCVRYNETCEYNAKPAKQPESRTHPRRTSPQPRNIRNSNDMTYGAGSPVSTSKSRTSKSRTSLPKPVLQENADVEDTASTDTSDDEDEDWQQSTRKSSQISKARRLSTAAPIAQGGEDNKDDEVGLDEYTSTKRPKRISGESKKNKRQEPGACNNCRKRRIKCDRNAPCNNCVKAKDMTCEYDPKLTGEAVKRSELQHSSFNEQLGSDQESDEESFEEDYKDEDEEPSGFQGNSKNTNAVATSKVKSRRFPKSFAEFSEAQKLLVRMRKEGKAFSEIMEACEAANDGVALSKNLGSFKKLWSRLCFVAPEFKPSNDLNPQDSKSRTARSPKSVQESSVAPLSIEVDSQAHTPESNATTSLTRIPNFLDQVYEDEVAMIEADSIEDASVKTPKKRKPHARWCEPCRDSPQKHSRPRCNHATPCNNCLEFGEKCVYLDEGYAVKRRSTASGVVADPQNLNGIAHSLEVDAEGSVSSQTLIPPRSDTPAVETTIPNTAFDTLTLKLLVAIVTASDLRSEHIDFAAAASELFSSRKAVTERFRRFQAKIPFPEGYQSPSPERDLVLLSAVISSTNSTAINWGQVATEMSSTQEEIAEMYSRWKTEYENSHDAREIAHMTGNAKSKTPKPRAPRERARSTKDISDSSDPDTPRDKKTARTSKLRTSKSKAAASEPDEMTSDGSVSDVSMSKTPRKVDKLAAVIVRTSDLSKINILTSAAAKLNISLSAIRNRYHRFKDKLPLSANHKHTEQEAELLVALVSSTETGMINWERAASELCCTPDAASQRYRRWKQNNKQNGDKAASTTKTLTSATSTSKIPLDTSMVVTPMSEPPISRTPVMRSSLSKTPRLSASQSMKPQSDATPAPATSQSFSSELESLKTRMKQLEDKLSRVNAREAQPSFSFMNGSIGTSGARMGSTQNSHPENGYPQAISRWITNKGHWINVSEILQGLCETVDPSMPGNAFKLVSGMKKCKALAGVIRRQRTPAWPSPPTKDLPVKEIADALVASYLRTTESVYRVLHIPTFRKDYDDFWTHNSAPDTAFLVQLKLVLAIGASTHDEKFTLRTSAIRWVYEAQTWISEPEFKSKAGIPQLQNNILLLIAQEAVDVGTDSAWESVDALVRRAMHARLHTISAESPKMPKLVIEMRRRLWTTIIEVALQSSLTPGGPPHSCLSDFDTEAPGNYDDEQLLIEHSLPNHDDVFTQSSVAIALRRTFPVRLSIARFLNDVDSSGTYQETLRLDAELRTAHKALYQTFQRLSRGEEPCTFILERRIADFTMHRYLSALHVPGFTAALKETSFAFSRKVVVETSLRLWNSVFRPSLIGTQPHENDPSRKDDLVSLATCGQGLFRTVVMQAAIIIAIDLKTQLQEEQDMGPVGLRADLLSVLEEANTWCLCCIGAGETSIKGFLLLRMISAKINGMSRGLIQKDVSRLLFQAAEAVQDSCLSIFEGLAAQSDYGESFKLSSVTGQAHEPSAGSNGIEETAVMNDEAEESEEPQGSPSTVPGNKETAAQSETAGKQLEASHKLHSDVPDMEMVDQHDAANKPLGADLRSSSTEPEYEHWDFMMADDLFIYGNGRPLNWNPLDGSVQGISL